MSAGGCVLLVVGSLGEEIFRVVGHRYLISLPRVMAADSGQAGALVEPPRTNGTLDGRDHLYKGFIVLY